jgi:hypothetical protein
MLFRLAESVVNIAHVPKRIRKQTSVSHAADCDVIVCYGGAKLVDEHLASKIHYVDDEIIGWLLGRAQFSQKIKLRRVSCFAHFRLPFRAMMDVKLTSRGSLQWSNTSTTPT